MNAIQECVKHAKISNPQEVERSASKIQEIETLLQSANERLKSLFGLEKHSQSAVQEKINRLKAEKVRVSRLAKYGAMPCLSLDFLKWRDKNGYPKIALLSLDSPRVRFSFTGVRGYDDYYDAYRTKWTARCEPDYTGLIRQAYKDVFKMLEGIAKKDKMSVHLTTEFSGIIPNATREKIIAAKDSFDDILIAAEATNWTLKTGKIPVIKPRLADPLVLGWDGHNFWIIDHFDMTSAEKYIKEEFAL